MSCRNNLAKAAKAVAREAGSVKLASWISTNSNNSRPGETSDYLVAKGAKVISLRKTETTEHFAFGSEHFSTVDISAVAPRHSVPISTCGAPTRLLLML
jgi:hypothetical protein